MLAAKEVVFSLLLFFFPQDKSVPLKGKALYEPCAAVIYSTCLSEP